MNEYQKIAELLYPNVKDYTFYLDKYKKRENVKGEVTRYAPSPTGYMHIGNFFQMFISYNLAKNTNGVFIRRLEDTDRKREKEGAFEVIEMVMDKFGIYPDEYETLNGEIKGDYGPYIQTERLDIYHSFAKHLVSIGKAFPCFCKAFENKEEILKDRETKFLDNDATEYDACRNLSFDEVKEHIDNGEKFAIRLKTSGDGIKRVTFTDLIKGEINANANAKDVILVKSDGIPPYTFCHIIDDKLMGVTTVVRGEEYISSTPVHLEIIDALGFDRFKYCHNPLICKIPENGNKRKISKRYDPEADMRYYFENGYPIESVLEYLLNLISSSFEEWRRNNPELSWKEFKFGINDITAVSPIFDLVKLNDISKNIISKMTAEEVYNNVLKWAKEYNNSWYELLLNNKDYAIKMFNIDRNIEKPRKDIYKWSSIPELYKYFYDEFYNPSSIEDYDLPNNYKCAKELLNEYLTIFDENDAKDTWFNKIKELGSKYGFAKEVKEYKKNKEAYIGHCGDVCTLIRVAVTGRTQTPDLYEILKLFGKEKIKNRFNKFYEFI